jgi:putative spermidine/putrescine transport system permease protein
MEFLSPEAPHQIGSGRKAPMVRLFVYLTPALLIIVLLFGGGLFLGFLQALGHTPAADLGELNYSHFIHVINDPDYMKSLGLTLYISATSTKIAAIISVILSLALIKWAPNSKFINFLLQIPLTVPHLVIAISVVLLLSPAGFFSRLFTAFTIIDNSSGFPLLVNDDWAIGILVVYTWKEIPFITFMLLSVLKNMGPELQEVGATLNANSFQRFFYIVLPLIAPSLCSGCLIVFAFTFGAFEVPYLLGQTYPMTLPVWAYKNYSDIDLLARPEGIAIGLLIALIIICFIITSQLLLQFSRKMGRVV